MTHPAPHDATAEPCLVEGDIFRLLVESVRDYAIFVLDATGHVATWNVGAQRIKGYSAKEIIGKHFSTFYPPEDIAAGKCERELAIADREGRYEEEGWRIRKDGSRFWANVTITGLRDDAGRLVGFAKVTRDLTERLRAEDDRVELKKAAHVNQVKSNFLRLVSHEFRTPLAALKLQLTRLSRGRGALAMSDAQRDVFGRMTTTMLRLQELVESLLSYARIESGRWEPKLESFDAVQIAHEVVDEFRPAVRNKPITLTAHPPSGERIDMVCDPYLVRLILTNLAGNALKFTERGSVDISVRRTADTVVFTVQDSGPGVPAEEQGRIFEPFEQIERVDSKHLQGFGLGLALVKEMATALKGRVELRSEAGAGCSFLVSLPSTPEGHAS